MPMLVIVKFTFGVTASKSMLHGQGLPKTSPLSTVTEMLVGARSATFPFGYAVSV